MTRLRSPKLAGGVEYLLGHPNSDSSQDSIAAGQIPDHRVPAVFELPSCISPEIRKTISGGGCQKQVNNLPMGRAEGGHPGLVCHP